MPKVTLSNGSVYDFSYDNYNNLIQIKLNNVVVFNYEYDLTTVNLIKQKYGANSDAFIFEYNTDGLIMKINYVNSSGVTSTKFNYISNDRKELVKITDANGNILNEYEYDSDGKVTCIKTSNSEIKNSYDNLDNVVSKSVKINNKSIFTSYDSVNRSKGSHPESLYEPYKKSSCYLATFDNDGKLNSELDAYLGAAVNGAIAGLGTGLGTTALSSGLGDVVGGVFDGSIKSFSDGCIAFASGAVLGAIGYGISNGISKGLARRKLNKIVPNWNAKNGKINKQLANAGYKNLKIGRDGYKKIFDTVYKDSGYDILNKGISYAYDFITSLF